MESDQYSVIFFGRVFPGSDPATVRARIGEVFHIGGPQLDKLFSGARIAIKKDLDLETAQRYRDAFQKAGALVELKKSEPAGASPAGAAQAAPEPSPVAASRAEGPGSPETAAVASDDEQMTLLPPRSGSLAEFAQEEAPAAIPDLSHLRIGAVGADLDLADQPPPPLELDLDGLDLEQPGADLNPDYQPPPPLQIDTEALSAAPANTGSLEEYAVPETPAPLPDISRLRLETPGSEDSNR